jgi:hypothetical protein
VAAVCAAVAAFAPSAALAASIATVSPTTIGFGDIRLGRSVSVDLTIVNKSAVALGGFAGGGVAAPFGATQNCAGGVPVGGSCVFTYSFTPTTAGTVNGSTTIVFSAGGQSLSTPVSLSGNGVGTVADVSPVIVDFGLVNVADSVAIPVTVSNPTAVTLGGFAGGGIAPPFGATQNCAGGVAPGASCAFTYSFTPIALGAVSKTTSFSFNVPSGASQSVAIGASGEGVGALAQVTPTTIGFGSVQVGGSVSVPVTITNTSPQTLTGFAGGGIAAPFGASQNCAGGVAPGASCVFTYTFSPTTTGLVSGSTSISFDVANGASQVVPLSFSGTGTTGAAFALVTPTTLDFGQIRVGQDVSVPVTIKNLGATPLGGFAGGGIGAPFGAVQNCAGGVPVGGSCEFVYSFTPEATGAVNGSTAIAFNNGSSSLNVPIALSGDGVGTLADVTPTSVDFGLVNVGNTVSFPVTVKNKSPATLTMFAGGGIGAPFGAVQNCAGGVAPGMSCEFVYSFTATTASASTGSTSFSFGVASGATQSVTISLAGTGSGTLAQVTPTTIGFGNIVVGQSASVSVTVTNTSPQKLTGFAGGGIAAPFGATQNCAGGVAPGATCVFIYSFTPAVLGLVSGSTAFSFSIANGASQNVPITVNGTGVASSPPLVPALRAPFMALLAVLLGAAGLSLRTTSRASRGRRSGRSR